MDRNEHFFTSPALPFVEARKSTNSGRHYKMHMHRRFSIGAINRGTPDPHRHVTNIFDYGDADAWISKLKTVRREWDLGGEEQLNQHGWTIFSGHSHNR